MKKSSGKQCRSLFYRVSAWLHLWLGLLTGIVIFIVSITGAILTFEDELRLAFQSYQTVEDQGLPLLKPSELANAVQLEYGIPGVSAVIYRGRSRSVLITWYGDRENLLVNYINPYTAKALHSQQLDTDFYRMMVVGHYQLWLPRAIGKPLVAYSTLIFVLTLFTGLVLWWPKKWNKTTRKKSFFIKTTGSFKRLNYDLHNVLGFYSLAIALILGLTGMVYGMKWFNDAVYWTASKGKAIESSIRPLSDTTHSAMSFLPDEDRLFNKVRTTEGYLENNQVTLAYPFGKQGVWGLAVNPKPGTRYLERSDYFEQHTLEKLKSDPEFRDLNGGEKLLKLNYDLHVGSIGGIPSKIIAFLACMVSASLPVTGCIVWLRKGKRRKPR